MIERLSKTEIRVKCHGDQPVRRATGTNGVGVEDRQYRKRPVVPLRFTAFTVAMYHLVHAIRWRPYAHAELDVGPGGVECTERANVMATGTSISTGRGGSLRWMRQDRHDEHPSAESSVEDAFTKSASYSRDAFCQSIISERVADPAGT